MGLLGCPDAVLVFSLVCVNAAQRQLKCPNYHHQMTIGILKTHRMDSNGNGVGQYDLHSHLHCTATGPGDGHCMHVF